MPLYRAFFYMLAAIITLATALSVSSRNLVHAVVYLIVSLLGTALLFYLLGAPMLAALEVIIYAGAIMVLFLIVIMLVQVDEQHGMRNLLRRAFFALGAGGAAFGLVMFWLYRAPGSLFPLQAAMASPQQFGAFVFENYWLAVEMVSFLLFAALVGAFYLSKGKSCPVKNLQEAPPPFTGGGWGVGEGTNCRPVSSFPPTLPLPRKGGRGLLAPRSPLQFPNRTALGKGDVARTDGALVEGEEQ